jgi:hypothetical protein
MQTRRLSFPFIMIYLGGLSGLWMVPVPASRAEGSSDKGSIVEGSGFSLYDMESIKGFDEKKIEGDPICDRSKRPKIHTVEPDEARVKILEPKSVFKAWPSARRDPPRLITNSSAIAPSKRRFLM